MQVNYRKLCVVCSSSCFAWMTECFLLTSFLGSIRFLFRFRCICVSLLYLLSFNDQSIAIEVMNRKDELINEHMVLIFICNFAFIPFYFDETKKNKNWHSSNTWNDNNLVEAKSARKWKKISACHQLITVIECEVDFICASIKQFLYASCYNLWMKYTVADWQLIIYKSIA